MKITFIGADHEVTGSCHFLNACGKNILVDYGMEQGVDTFENAPVPVNAAEIDYVFLTHAHIDHSGLLPLLVQRGFRGQIFSTEATADLVSIMLRDSAHIQSFEAEWQNRKAKRSGSLKEYEPLYTMEDADGAIRKLVPCPYAKRMNIFTSNDESEGIDIRFTDVGHLLGSSAIEVWVQEKAENAESNDDTISKKIVFSGDIGNVDQPLIKDPAVVEEADYVLIESTYGDRLHTTERPDYVKELSKIIKETFDRGGNLVIPSFAVGRTQEMLYFIRQIKAKQMVPGHENFKVYVDSPLAVEATGVFNKNIHSCFDEEAMELVNKGINPITFPGLTLAISSDESKAINFDDEPKVIISASGMCEAGRIRHHLKHNLWRAESTILFVGYQAVGTLGRSLVEHADDDNFEVRLFGESIEVRAKICQLAGLSGHADKDGLLKWIHGFKKKPSKVFVVHGEDSVCERFKECLIHEHGFDATAPYSGSTYDLVKNEYTTCASPIKVAPKAKIKTVSSVFARFLAAAERLLAIVKQSDGLANKDMAKFADQINALCDKIEH